MRVFCCECRHYSRRFYEHKDSCKAEGNRQYVPDYEGNFYKLIRHPSKINKFGDCRWYEKIGG